MKVTTNWKNKHEFESNQDANTIKLDGNKKMALAPKRYCWPGLRAALE